MNHDTPVPATTLRDATAEGKHCVVRLGTSWFSLPAKAVHEITFTPNLVALPQCDAVLAGLCHLRSEFIPVLSLEALVDVDASEQRSERRQLVVIKDRNAWAFEITEAAAIASLETLVAPENRNEEGGQSPVIGTAMFRDQIVRVLDPSALFRLALESLENDWHGTEPQLCEQF